MHNSNLQIIATTFVLGMAASVVGILIFEGGNILIKKIRTIIKDGKVRGR